MLRSSSSDPTDQKQRACQNCFKSKSKCILSTSDSGSKCSRCFRLKKECVIPPKSTRKRKSPTSTVNIGHLEERIESLVSLLSSAEGAVAKNHLTPSKTQGSTSPVPETNAQEIRSSKTRIDVSSTVSKPSWTNQIPLSLPKHSTIQSQRPLAAASNVRDAGLFNLETLQGVPITERPFEVYRTQFDPQMPFSFIPPGISPHDLQRQKPWLYRTCLMVGMVQDKNRQIEIAGNILVEISQGMLLRGEKSLDMLQSLLIHNAWAAFQEILRLLHTCQIVEILLSMSRGNNYTRLNPSKKSHADFSLAIAMLYDLGLPKKAPENEGPAELLSESMVKEVPENSMLEKRSAEERRVLLACYLLASVYSLCVRKIDIFPTYSPYIGYCCERILTGPHDEKDLLLVSIVKFQSKVEAFYRSLPTKEIFGEIKAPLWMYVKSVEADFESYWLSLPAKIKENFFMIVHYRTARVLLYEPSLQKTLFPTVTFESPDSHRLDMLYTCLISCQQALDNFLAQPLQFFATLSTLLLSHLGHTLSTLLKLSMIDEPGWDLNHVHQTVNVIMYFDEFMQRFEEVGADLDRCTSSSPFLMSMPTMCARGMRKLKGWYESKIAVELNQGTQQAPMSVGNEFNMDIDLFDFDDTYWLDLMSDNILQ